MAWWRYDGAMSLEIWNSVIHQSDPAEVVKKGWASLEWLESRFDLHPKVTS